MHFFFFKLLAGQSLMASAGQMAPARPEKPQSRPGTRHAVPSSAHPPSPHWVHNHLIFIWTSFTAKVYKKWLNTDPRAPTRGEMADSSNVAAKRRRGLQAAKERNRRPASAGLQEKAGKKVTQMLPKQAGVISGWRSITSTVSVQPLLAPGRDLSFCANGDSSPGKDPLGSHASYDWKGVF